MAHGSEDYKEGASVATVYVVNDLGELAVRLGSPVSFDRRGNVLWFDDFEHSLNKWDVSYLGTGSSVAISNERARTGALSCKLVTGNSADDYAQLVHYEPYPVLSKLGLEFSLNTLELQGIITFLLNAYTGTYLHDARIRFNITSQTWEYFNASGSWVALSTAALMVSDAYMFNTLKLVIDPSTQKYVRLICNNVSLDMSALGYYYGSYSGRARFEVQIKYTTDVDASKEAYVDDVILTQNEP